MRAYSGYTKTSFATDYSLLTPEFDMVQPTVDCSTMTTCLALAPEDTSYWAVQVRGTETCGMTR